MLQHISRTLPEDSAGVTWQSCSCGSAEYAARQQWLTCSNTVSLYTSIRTGHYEKVSINDTVIVVYTFKSERRMTLKWSDSYVSLWWSALQYAYTHMLCFEPLNWIFLQYHPIVLPESPLVLWSWNQLCYLCLWNRPTLLYECHLTIPFTSWINNQQHVAWKNYELMYSQWGYDHITACVPLYY